MCQDLSSPATTVLHHQFFVTRDILFALKRPIPAQDEGENLIRHRIRCCGRARENEGASTTWSLNEPSEKGARSAGVSESWRSWNRTTSGRMGDVENESPNENVSHLQTLLRKAEASVREACREGGSSTSVTTNPIGPIGAACRRHNDEELKCPRPSLCQTKPVGKKSGKHLFDG